ncbi:bi-domain-containing oxidoreductase [bacterium AH-315-F03]|nr:bi-domain-containing oxidoreductase [bacterium AH-315-F03]
MKQALQYPKRGELRIEELPTPALKAGGVIIENRASLLSAGTERSIIQMAEKSLMGKAKERPDLVRQVLEKAKTEGILNTYRKVKSRLDMPTPLGYSCAGYVTQVASDVNELTVGQRVAAAGFGYASHAETVFVPKNLTAVIPDNVTMEEASFVTLGAIALQGVRQANPVLGETIAVIGLGLLGQLTVQMLKANGCRVVGLDIDKGKLKLAAEHGCDCAIDNGSASAIKETIAFTGGVGVDRVIVTAASSSKEIMNTAAEICRDRGHVTVVGAVNMELERRPFYSKELSMNLSRSYGPGRYDFQYEEQGYDYPIGYVRWTERRNMQCFLQMISDRQVNVKALITHNFPIENAEAGYDLVMGRTEGDYLGIIIRYAGVSNKPLCSSSESTITTIAIRKTDNNKRNKDANNSAMNLCAVGAGNFSTGVLYPILRNLKNVNLTHLVAPNGMKAMNTAKQFGFANASTSFAETLADQTVNACLIATPHNLHAEQVITALDANKHVFVEKPLATNAEELTAVRQAYLNSTGKLMVGFNRRFAPATLKIKHELDKIDMPGMYSYRVNAGFIPKEHPLQDDTIGKGRIIGEVCHFVDLLQFLSDSSIVSVQCDGVCFNGGQYLSDDNVQIAMRLSDGSMASLIYIACGGAGLAKETMEIHTGGVSFIMNDFTKAEMYRSGTVKKLYSGTQDKGHSAELKTFVSMSASDPYATILAEDAFSATEVTLAIVESLKSGSLVKVQQTKSVS